MGYGDYDDSSWGDSVLILGAFCCGVFVLVLTIIACRNTYVADRSSVIMKTSELPKIISHSISRYGHETIVCEDGTLWDEYGVYGWKKRQ